MAFGRSTGFIGRGGGGGGCSAARSHGWSGFGGNAPIIAPLTPYHQARSRRHASGGRRAQSCASTLDLDLLPTTLHSLPALPFLSDLTKQPDTDWYKKRIGKTRPRTRDSMKTSESLPNLASPKEESTLVLDALPTSPSSSMKLAERIRSPAGNLHTSLTPSVERMRSPTGNLRTTLTPSGAKPIATDVLMTHLVMNMHTTKNTKNRFANLRKTAVQEGMGKLLANREGEEEATRDRKAILGQSKDSGFMEKVTRRKSINARRMSRRSSNLRDSIMKFSANAASVPSLAPIQDDDSDEDGESDDDSDGEGKPTFAKTASRMGKIHSKKDRRGSIRRASVNGMEKFVSEEEYEHSTRAHWGTVFSRFEDQGEVHRDLLHHTLTLVGFAKPIQELIDQASNTISTFATFNKEEFFDFLQLYATLERDHMKSTFARYDRDKNGSLDVQELKPLLEHYGMTPLTYVVQGILDEVDEDNNGSLDFEEFKACTVILRDQSGFTEQEADDLCFAFHKFDRSQNGSMSTVELAGALNWLGYSLAMKDVMAIGQEVDFDRTGRISLDEFLTCMRKVREREFLRIKQVIQDCDTNQSGGIDGTEFANVLRALGYNPEREAVSQALEDAGVTDCENEYGLDEICQFLEIFRLRDGFSRDECEEIEDAFDLYDFDGEGILAQEVQNLLIRLGYKINFDVMQKLILKVDVDHSGTLDVSEFRKLIRIFRKQENSKMNRAFDKYFENKNRPHSSEDKIEFEHAMAALRILFDESAVSKFVENNDDSEWHYGDGMTRQLFESTVQKIRALDREAVKNSAEFNEHQLQELSVKFHHYETAEVGRIAPEKLQNVVADLVTSLELKMEGAEEELSRAAEVDPNGHLDFTGFVRLVRLAKDILDRYLQRRKEQDLIHTTNFSETELVGLRHVFMHRELNRHSELPFSEFQLILADLVPLKIKHIEELKQIFERITRKASADFAEFTLIWDTLLKEDFLGLANLGKSTDAN